MDAYPSAARSTQKRKALSDAQDVNDAPFGSQSQPAKARRRLTTVPEIIDLTGDSPPNSPKKKSRRGNAPQAEEKRRRQFRARAPQGYLVVKQRALTQRLTVLSRERGGTDDLPTEKVRVAGSTGNVYTIQIDLMPRCNCPHAVKGNQCKHIVYVMLRVLKAREEIAYQLALLRCELREVMKNAPPIPGVETNGRDGTETDGEDANRKPIEGECPICYDELEDKDGTVYCTSSCGNNVHTDCMQKWIAISKGNATCPYCRAIWAEDSGLKGKLGEIDTRGLQRNEDGYVNVAAQLGLHGQRDTSTYHRFWSMHSHPGYRDNGYGYWGR